MAALIIEPVLGEGGYLPTSSMFMNALREFCNTHGILLIADEVQSGYGRTGKMFAVEHTDTRPDILIAAKGIASGYPLASVITRSEISAKQSAGCMGGTYGGNAVACAAAIATLDVFEQEDLLGNVHKRSAQAFNSLAKMETDFPDVIGEVRGRGLMIGVEFDPQFKGIAAAVANRCMEKDMLLLVTGVHETVRLIPPLTISEKEMADGMQALEDSIAEIADEVGLARKQAAN